MTKSTIYIPSEISKRATRKTCRVLTTALAISTSEKEVENAWWQWFNRVFDAQVTSPHNTDGVIKEKVFTNSGSYLRQLKTKKLKTIPYKD